MKNFPQIFLIRNLQVFFFQFSFFVLKYFLFYKVKILNFFFCPQSKWFHWYWTAIDENPPDFKDEEIYKIPSLKFSIIKKFGSDALTPEEQKPSHGILSKVLFGLFFKRLETLTSIKFSAKAKEYVEVKSHNDSFQLVETDIDSLELRVKHMSLVDLCSGSALLDRAFQSQSEDEIKRLLETATERLLKAWNSYSENEQVLYQFGVANWKLAQLRTTIMARTALTEDYKEKINLLNLYDLAIDNFEKASQNNDRNFHYFLKAGYALCDCVLVDKYDQKKIQSAGSHIEKAISLNNESLNNKILKVGEKNIRIFFSEKTFFFLSFLLERILRVSW